VCTCAEGYIDINCGIMDPCESSPCINSGSCTTVFAEGTVDGQRTEDDVSFTCACTEKFTGDLCDSPLEQTGGGANPNLAVTIAVPIVVCIALALIIGLVVCFCITKKKRATRGRYSPSRNEINGPNLQMAGMLKPPPEERLI